MAGWIYMTANRYRGTLYTGVTTNLARRMWQHREGRGSSFVKRYGVTHLVFAEPHDCIESAIRREKQIKEWKRAWKVELIEAANPDWCDLWEVMNGGAEEGAGFRLSPE